MARAFAGDAGSTAFTAPTVDKQMKVKTIKPGVRMSFSTDASIRRHLAPTEIVGVSGAL
jgi:hypothetical protein